MNAKKIAIAVIAALLLTGTALAAAQSPEGGTIAATQPTTRLTAQEVEAAALAHAGLTASEVTELRSHEDLDDGIPEWDVEFRQGDWEFDYEIHAETGAVLHADKDYEPIAPAPTSAPPAPTERAPTDPPATEPPDTEPPRQLTADEAEAFALAHAGLNGSQVTGLRSEFDYDDGVPEWDVEFRQGDWEYDYAIHAETGEVRSWDKEYDPEKTTASTSKPAQSAPAATQPPAQEKRLTAEEAKSIALKHAGLSAGEVSRLKAEFDYDDGRPEYDVEFYAGGYEYDYEIHGETGKILKWDKERDD